MIINEAGTWKLSSIGGAQSPNLIVYISGTGTAELGYFDDFETWIPIVDGDLSPGEQYQVFSGQDNPIFIKVPAGANLSVKVCGTR